MRRLAFVRSGFRGTHQAEHGDPPEHIDAQTGVRVFSVYRRNASSICAVLRETGAASVLVDLQDAGTRLYTFVWTLYDVMAAAGTMATPPTFVVADRPNPLGGVHVEGPLLNTSCCASRYGRLAIPHRHGLTVGELVRLFASELGASAPPVHIVPMRGWRRALAFDQLNGLPWLPPSPNLPTVASAIAVCARGLKPSTGPVLPPPLSLCLIPAVDSTRSRYGLRPRQR